MSPLWGPFASPLLPFFFFVFHLLIFVSLVAPEIIEVSGAQPISDIWSLGCTVIEMLTGDPPYFNLSTMQALFLIVEDAHPPIPEGLSEPLAHFLVRSHLQSQPPLLSFWPLFGLLLLKNTKPHRSPETFLLQQATSRGLLTPVF